MDISKIDNLEELKALAYDQILTIETAQINLKNLQDRIIQVEKNQKNNNAKAPKR